MLPPVTHGTSSSSVFVRGVLRKLLLEHRNLLLERSSVRADSPFLDQTAVQHVMRRRRLLAEGMRVGLFDLLAHFFRYFRLCGKAGDRLRRQLDRRQALVLLALRDHRADGALHLEKNASSACSSSSPNASITTFLNASLSSAAVRCEMQPSTFSMNSACDGRPVRT